MCNLFMIPGKLKTGTELCNIFTELHNILDRFWKGCEFGSRDNELVLFVISLVDGRSGAFGIARRQLLLRGLVVGVTRIEVRMPRVRVALEETRTDNSFATRNANKRDRPGKRCHPCQLHNTTAELWLELSLTRTGARILMQLEVGGTIVPWDFPNACRI